MNFGDDEASASTDQGAATGARLIPRITIQAFCEHSQTAELIESAVRDRRMSKVALTTRNGGIEGAIETFKANPTPNLIIVESSSEAEQLLAGLESLATVCDAGTRLVILGHVNDVVLYRDLIRFGVSEYLVLPTSAQALVNSISDLFATEGAGPIGRTIAFVSAKGGSGSSTVAHNVAWSIADQLQQEVLILDTDFGFGTVGLNFNQDPPNGLADAVFSNEKVDATMLDRLMSKAAAHINLLTAPGTLDRTYDFGKDDFEQVIEIAQATVPIVILDIPHAWTSWIEHTLSTVDEIVIVAEPDLANLRNAKNIADAIKSLRPAETDPLLVINKKDIPKRPEINSSEFSDSIDCRLIGEVGFDAATFGTAANNGQMIAEVAQNHRANEIYQFIGREVTGRNHTEMASKPTSFLSKILKRA